MKWFARSLVGFLSLIAAALVIISLFHLTSWGTETGPAAQVDATPVNRDARFGASFTPVVRKAAPGVVNIYSTRIVHERLVRNPLLNDPVFRQLFGNQFPNDDRKRIRREQNLGSGVIVSPDGYILTANHVVDGADEIKVSFGENKTENAAKIIGTDPPTDVAVLKIDAKNLPALTLADSDQLEIGDIVLAIGNPYGLGQTVTMGIVSALGRNGLAGFNQYQDFIQTDAAINPGNSGGALVDAQGRLVGINTAIISRSGGNQGIGFAVPINLARHVMERLINGDGKVARGYLDISMQSLDAGLAKQFNLPVQNGALVDDVTPGTPAEKAGFKSGDVIVAFNDKEVSDAHSLILSVADCSPGSLATVKLFRDGRTNVITVKLVGLPLDAEKPGGVRTGTRFDSSKTDALNGVTVQDLNQGVRQQLDMPDDLQGALMINVDQDSNSAEAGLQRGDVIVEINRQPVRNAADAVRLGWQAKGDQILLRVWRRDGDFAGTHYLTVNNAKKLK
ncbi:MAG: Do family serine endopeptidase [Verrucomicrobiia bacterium]